MGWPIVHPPNGACGPPPTIPKLFTLNGIENVPHIRLDLWARFVIEQSGGRANVGAQHAGNRYGAT